MRYLLAIMMAVLLGFASLADVQAQGAPEFEEGVVLVKFRPGSAKNKKDEVLQSVNGETEEEYTIVPGLQKITTNLDVEKAVEILSKNPNVEFAEPDYIVSLNQNIPNDSDFTNLWGMHNTGQSGGTSDADIDAPEAWDIETGDPNVIVAVIDTGVDYNHSDLNDNMWTNPGEIPGNGIDDDSNGVIDDVYGLNTCLADNPAGDPMANRHSHGTHVSGTICGEGNNSQGVAGVMWDCKIMALKFLCGTGGSGSTSNAVTLLQYVKDIADNTGQVARVSNNSWGGGGFSSSLKSAIDSMQAYGHLFIAAAGNGGFDRVGDNNDSTPHYPSSYTSSNLIAVAATDRNDNRASFSNYGATSVDLGAPGVSIYSTVTGGGYSSWSGTSMATPHVAGAAGLLLSHNSACTYQEIRDQILSTTVPNSALSQTVTGGGLNVFNAVSTLSCAGGPPTDVCGDGTCGASESCSTCEADCGACSFCGDDTCDADETCSTCSADCGACSFCGDDTCDADETCSTCSADCGPCSFCGDGTCDADESCSTCATDCGTCNPCGNGTCDVGEDCNSCPQDCISGTGSSCGNGVCEAGNGEDCGSCSQDCASKTNGHPKTQYCCGENGLCGNSSCNASPYSCTQIPAQDYCCGDAECTGEEDSSSCEIDCPPGLCGDGTCDANEDCSTCSADCGACPFCGDGTCDANENCSTCEADCGTCSSCVPTHSKEKGPRCSDGIDNDCDDLIDAADPDC